MIHTTTDDIQNASTVPGTTLSDALANVTAGAGGLAPADRAKLDGIQTGATANDTDAALRDRSTHTGTQTAATISDLLQAISDILQAGSNVTITPSGGQLVIASVGGGGGGGSVNWGSIAGALANQADLASALNTKANTSALAAVATAGTYASLTGKPTLGTAAAANTGDFATAVQGAKADSAVQPAGLAPYAKTADLPPVPTALSQLTNDTGFVSDISGKVDKVAGKGLSTEDYSSAEKAKLSGIATGATANAADADLRDRAKHTGTQATSTIAGLPAALDAKLSSANPVVASGTVQEAVFAIADAAGAVLSPTNGSIQTWTLGANRTPTAGTWVSGQGILLMVDDGAAYTITWTSLPVTWLTSDGNAPTLKTSGYTAVVLWKVGSTIYGK